MSQSQYCSKSCLEYLMGGCLSTLHLPMMKEYAYQMEIEIICYLQMHHLKINKSIILHLVESKYGYRTKISL